MQNWRQKQVKLRTPADAERPVQSVTLKEVATPDWSRL